jgi:hypothetical protein
MPKTGGNGAGFYTILQLLTSVVSGRKHFFFTWGKKYFFDLPLFRCAADKEKPDGQSGF